MNRIFLLGFGVCAMSLTAFACAPKQSKSKAADKTDNNMMVAMDKEHGRSGNEFAIDFFKAVNRYNSNGKNVFVSPLSVNIALNMVSNGASGETLNEILNALRQSGYSMEEINNYSKAMRNMLLEADDDTVISIANSIWYSQEVTVSGTFKKTLAEYYSATAQGLDFSDPKSLDIINGWCLDNTNGKIQKVLEALPADAVMYLINAIYFNGTWEMPFNKDLTNDAPFYGSKGTQTVDMMRQTGFYKIYEDELGVYVEMPYKGGAFSMIVMLPHKDIGAEKVVESLGADYLNGILDSMKHTRIELQLPRFKFEGSYTLQDNVFPSMGMKRAFTTSADFSRMITDAPTYISAVIHKTFVEVNEEGTEAAAVTAIGMTRTSLAPDPRTIVVNRPFIFAVRDNENNTLLFMGRMDSI